MGRELSWHEKRELHKIDQLADVRWDEEQHVWVLYWDNIRICCLYHSDGSNMVELCLDEVRDILARNDNYKDGPERVKTMRRRAADAKANAARRQELMMEESIREAEAVARNQMNGCPLQVSMV